MVLLIVRSPFAFTDTFRRHMRWQAWEAANTWRDTYYDSIRLVSETGIPALVVRQEDLARDAEWALRPAQTLLGVGQWPARNRARRSQADEHYFVGLRDRESTTEGVEYDADPVTTSWYERLSADDIESVMQTPGLVDLANQLGYQLRRDISAWRQAQTA